MLCLTFPRKNPQMYKNEAFFKLNTFMESTELNIVQCLIFGCSTSNIQSRRDPWHRLLDARWQPGCTRKEIKLEAPNRKTSQMQKTIPNSTELGEELALFLNSDNATKGEGTALVKDYKLLKQLTSTPKTACWMVAQSQDLWSQLSQPAPGSWHQHL